MNRRPKKPALTPAPAGDEPAELSEAATCLSRQYTVYRRTMEVCDELADAALKGVDPTELTRVFAALVDKRIVLMDAAFTPRADAGADSEAAALWWDRSDASIDRLRRALTVRRRPLRVPSVPGSLLEQGCLITPIVVSEETLGYLLVLDSTDDAEPDDVDLLTVTYAATLFALTLAHERTTTELGMRYQRAIVEALVSGHFLDAEDARHKGRTLGIDAAGGCRVGVVRVDRTASSADVETVVRRLSAVLPGVVAPTHESRAVLIVPDPTRPPALPELWRRVAGPANTTLTCGVSERLTSLEQAPLGLRQAEQAVDLGLRLGRAGQLVHHDDLGIYRLLLRIGDMSELWEFADDVLGPVIQYDASHKLNLVQTLSTYLRYQGSLKQAARHLYIHPNTVAYRAQRIEQLTGLALSDPDDRLLAHAAVKIVEAHRAMDK